MICLDILVFFLMIFHYQVINLPSGDTESLGLHSLAKDMDWSRYDWLNLIFGFGSMFVPQVGAVIHLSTLHTDLCGHRAGGE